MKGKVFKEVLLFICMNKRIILSIAILSLFSFSVFVSGIMTSILNIDEWNVELSLQKGWNLVPGFNTDSIESDSNIQAEDILATFVYVREKNKYMIFETEDTSSEFFKYFNSATGDEKDYVRQVPVWIYIERVGNIKYLRGSFPSLGGFVLKQGWNFISITPDMLDKSLMDIKGNCNIEKAFPFDIATQSWDDDLLISGWKFKENTIVEPGRGFAIKVIEDCELGMSSGEIIDVPQLPD